MGKEQIERNLGIPFGEKREPLSDVFDAFSQIGVEVDAGTVSRIRNDHSSGAKIADRVATAERLASGDPTFKLTFLLNLFKTAIDLRTNQSGFNAHKLNSKGFVEEVAIATGSDPQVIRRLIRSVRADLVYSEMDLTEASYKEVVLGVMNRYLEDFVENKGTKSTTPIERVSESWNRSTVKDFYSKMYQHMPMRAIGTWVPYEVEGMQSYAQWQHDSRLGFTTFDNKALSHKVVGRHEESLAVEVFFDTGISLDPVTIGEYRKLLVYGSPSFIVSERALQARRA